MVHYCATKQWLVCCGRLIHRPYAHWLSLLYVMMADRWSCLQEAQASSQASTYDVITFAVTDTFCFQIFGQEGLINVGRWHPIDNQSCSDYSSHCMWTGDTWRSEWGHFERYWWLIETLLESTRLLAGATQTRRTWDLWMNDEVFSSIHSISLPVTGGKIES